MKSKQIIIEKEKYQTLLEKVLEFKKVKGGGHFVKALQNKLNKMSVVSASCNPNEALKIVIEDMRLILEYHDLMMMPDDDGLHEPLTDQLLAELVKGSTDV